ncbi:DUF6483 family protein [Lachnoclostridium phytofermentans]|uniref:Uncharacterized protein n=1 Tax=Lachnoclostridium phytofermentans (strain ATCC 700394 / DSM 18823 / ISDg) TaxID=357809 RepID=A9KRT9_LACP7|nr:DUF6483 family protein [Lachnoclostridium phytofermentans]ABX43583.1 conserved hypothetical protein [Lachnoclostridium phytofermentans ISDg]
MFEEDYIMRLINQVIRTLLKLLFNIDTEKKEELNFILNETEDKYDELLNLIDKGQINEAENKLIEELNPKDNQYYKKALTFYAYLNDKDDDFLIEHDYSKKEIAEGLKYVSEIYGYGSMVNTLFSMISDD